MDLKEFKNPGSQYRGAPFWSWNGKLEPEELRRQIQIMKHMGLGGFFMHSRVGLDTPYLSKEWFECINTCADEAKKLNMKAYLYDEDRWPSGAAGGLVTKNSKYRMRYLVMAMTKDIKKIKWTKNVIAIFIAEFKGEIIKKYSYLKNGKKIKTLSPSETMLIFSIEQEKPSDWFNGYTYLDTMNPGAVKEFINTTHNAYKKNSGRHFGLSIPGIFTDEPHYGLNFAHWAGADAPEGYIMVSWTDHLPEVFHKRYGYNILDHLPEIYFDMEGQKISKARYHYRDCLTFLFVDSFAKQIGQWCEKNKILFTGHVLCEDFLSSQVQWIGSTLRFYEYMQAPGMDLLTEHWRIFNTAKQVSSVARQFGRKWRLTETYGCTGWDFPLTGHKALGDWQVALGINLRCQHLSYYTMLGEAKRDYPASISYQSPWWDAYPKVEDYFARVHSIMTKGEEVRDLLVVHPIESMWAIFKAPKWNTEKKTEKQDTKVKEYDEMFATLCDTLLSSHIDFDYGDEEILSRWAKVSKKNGVPVLIVNKAKYKAVLVPPLYTIRSSTIKLLKKFKQTGGQVVFVDKAPEYVDAVCSMQANDFAKSCENVSSFKEAITRIEKTSRKISITDKEGKEINPALYLLREDKEAFYLFVCNTGMNWDNKDVFARSPLARERLIEFPEVIIKAVPEWKHQPIELDPETGNICLANSIKTDTGYQIKTDLGPIASRLFIIPKSDTIQTVIARNMSSSCGGQGQAISFLTGKENLQEVDRFKIEKEIWEIKLSEPNICVLDRPFYKIGNGKWKQEEILRIDKTVRQHLSIKERGGAMVQPWARKKNKNPRNAPVTLKYLFDIEKIPSGEISLAIEKPELFKIKINGSKILAKLENGWWVDKSLKTLKFNSSILRAGRNEVLLECNYNENHPGLEIVYILGDFGVKIKGKQVILCEPVGFLKIGDWTEQGLPFYSGNIGYTCKIIRDLKENQRIFVNISDYRGAGIRILVDGKGAGVIGWQPNQLDITNYVRGKQEVVLTIEVLGHRRNSHGPLHLSEKWPIWTGPGSFVAEGKDWFEGYQTVPCGLMSRPEIIIKEKQI